MMMHLAKTAVLFLSLLGLADLSCRLAFGKDTLGKFQDAVITKWTDTWQEENPYGEKPKWSAWQEAQECFFRCGADRDCQASCPKPWRYHARRCESLAPIQQCHRACRHDGSCHEKCPMPQEPKQQQKVKESALCHHTCAKGDLECHRRCPAPLGRFLDMKCHWILTKVKCHEACGYGNLECNHRCGFPFDRKGGRGEGKLSERLGQAAMMQGHGMVAKVAEKLAGLKKYVKEAEDRMRAKEEMTKAKLKEAKKEADQAVKKAANATLAANTTSARARQLEVGSKPTVHV